MNVCEYCQSNTHKTPKCGVKVLDKARARGFFVDFPEEAEANRTAGQARLAEYAARTQRKNI